MIPGVGGTQTLPRRAGEARALEAILTGRRLGGGAAAAAGGGEPGVPPAPEDATALAVARRLAALDPAHVRAARRAVRAAHDLDLGAAIALERRLALGLERRR
jgi:enoyl-CoA hydratase